MTLGFSLTPVPPFRLDLTAWTLRRSEKNGIDVWDGTSYRRVLAVNGSPVLVAVRQQGSLLEVTARTTARTPDLEPQIRQSLGRLLGLDLDLGAFYDMASQDRRLRRLTDRFRGFKPPRFDTVFEGLLNGISCQQLSLAAGLTVLTRLSSRFGLPMAGTDLHACPRPADLAPRRPAAIREVGYSGAKARALLAASRAIVRGDLNLEGLSTLDDQEALAQLLACAGVGRWTAEYVLLRGLGRLNVFPGDDVGARNGLRRWLRLRRTLDYDAVHQMLDAWRPWGGLIYFHMLLSGLERAGHVAGTD